MHVRLVRSRRAIVHLARPGITLDAVALALEGPVYRRKAGPLLRVICRTPDRCLFVVLRPLGYDKLAEVITAPDATADEKRLYVHRGKL